MADWEAIKNNINAEWDATIVPTLCKYIEIPNQSPHYDPEWATNKLIEKAFAVLVDWLKQQTVKGMKFEMLEEPGRTPFLIIEIDGTTPTEKTLFMYGHMDKQPPLLPWSEGLGPYTPVIRNGKLYGRGGADDGYAICASVTAIATLQKHGVPHARTVITIEACEESGSFDLPHYINKLKPRIGDVDLVVCLDSGALNYDQLWLTTSLRGVAGGVLTVELLKDGMHSGVAGGVVPDSFRIARHLLNRIEDPVTGRFLVEKAYANIPESIVEQYQAFNKLDFKSQFALLPGVSSEDGDNVQLALNNFWKPCLTITGANLPDPARAGNVSRARTALKLSIRCPPGTSTTDVSLEVKRLLEENPPYGAKVVYDPEASANGWQAPELQAWLAKSLEDGSKAVFGQNFAGQGLGGSIPFMGMLGELYPKAQFVVTGVLGPQSNAHGPDEFLHIDFGKKITYCVTRVVADHYQQQGKN